MKTDRIMWGIVLLFIGGVLLLENFNIIDFHWGRVWRFWPIFMIIAGVNILFSKSKSELAGIVSIGILVLTLGILFYKGQQPSLRSTTVYSDTRESHDSDVAEDVTYSHPYTDSTSVKTILELSGGGTSFELKGSTDSLILADVHRKLGNYLLETNKTDSITSVSFKMKGKSKWNMGDGGNEVNLKLNANPIWEIKMNMGAGEINFDLSDFKVREFNFDGGAAALDIKFGDRLPITDVNVKTGVADVKIHVPVNSGCRIKTKTGLSSKDFSGFTKLEEGLYETPNYTGSSKKIFINLDGGLSNFEVKRY